MSADLLVKVPAVSERWAGAAIAVVTEPLKGKCRAKVHAHAPSRAVCVLVVYPAIIEPWSWG